MLELNDISISAGGKSVVSNLSFMVERGRMLQLRGSSGSGKSVVIGAIMGLWPLRSGVISLNGEIITRRSAPYMRKLMAYMPQRFDIGDMRVSDILSLFTQMERASSLRTNKRRLFDSWDLFGIDHSLIDSRCDEMSAADLQLVMLTLACVSRKEVLLADDPVSCQSEARRNAVAELLRRKASEGASVIVTGNDAYFSKVADMVVDL